jgi:DNA topoisomerase IB
VLACATRLLDRGFFRMGTEGYAEQNQTYGLATIQKRHVRLEGDLITFDYVSKSGKRRLASVLDPAVGEVVAQLKRRRGGGPELLAYKRGRTWVDVRSEDINAYIKEQTGGDFTAKDFRTWHASVMALQRLHPCDAALAKDARERIKQVIAEVAQALGHTVTVCRKSYVHPDVLAHFADGRLRALCEPHPGSRIARLRGLGAAERQLLALTGVRVRTATSRPARRSRPARSPTA